MTATTAAAPTAYRHQAPAPVFNRLLRDSGAVWFLCAAAGQLMFAAYLAGLYGAGVVRGDISVWNRFMPQGYIPGDTAGNAALFAHVLLALVITVGGLAQLTPQIRHAAPAFHRWTGRMYLTLAVIIALTGLGLTWGRPAAASQFNHLAITLNAVLILVCAGFAVRYAIARRIDHHRRWATRLFLVVSGVWFLRIMVAGWIAWHQAPLWLGSDLGGPMGIVIGFASTLLPLAVYEVYWRTRASAQRWPKPAMTAVMLGLAGLTAFGGFAASQIFWLPNIG